jgi:hypothetical protein
MTFRDLIASKTLRFIVLSVVLGALGSGLWEWLVKPSLLWVSHFGLNIATLGISSFKDSIYEEVALGFHEAPSLRLYLAICSFLPCFLLGVLSGVVAARRSMRRSLEAKSETMFWKVMTRMARPTFIVMIFLIVFSMVQANQSVYVNRAITHFHVLIEISRPYISDEQYRRYKSQFAQVSSKAEYEQVVKGLTDICRSNNLRTPELSIW